LWGIEASETHLLNMVPANKTAEAGSPSSSSEQDVVDPLWQRVLNDRFTLLEPIGSGGMGRVYRAIQSPLDRIVAIKILNPNYANAQDPGFRQRFFLEASLTSKLRHPNTITVIDYGQTPDGIFFIAMEYLEGQPLSKLLAHHGALHWTRALQIAQQIGRSLREAHKIGIVHRDLKPANVMLLTEDREDLVKVLDFGLVKSFMREREGNPTNSEVTNAGMFLGSRRNMAYEQARNHADPRSDVYSLGVVLYHMLVGRPPFVAKDSIDVIFKQMNEPPPPMRSLRPEIELPREIEALVMKCLEKQPSWRFQSMEDVLEAMRKSASASGMGAILADGNGTANTPPQMSMREALGGQVAPESTLAIDISVVSDVRKAPALLRNRKLLGAAIFLLSATFAFSGSYLLTKRGMRQTPIAAAIPAAISPSPPADAKPPPPDPEDLPAPSKPTPKLVRFRVSTEPQGAHVSMAGHSVGATPVSFEVPANSDGTATAELLLTLKGYHPMTVITGGSGPEVVLTQRLQSKATPRPANNVVDRRETVQKQAQQAAEAAEKPEEKKEEETPAPAQVQRVAAERSSTGGAGAAAASATLSSATGGGAAPATGSAPARVVPSFVIDAQRISSPNPHLPDSFRESHPRQLVRGTYRICVNTSGRVSDVSIVASIPGLDQAIIEQLKRTWVYKPQPVPVCSERNFIFKID